MQRAATGPFCCECKLLTLVSINLQAQLKKVFLAMRPATGMDEPVEKFNVPLKPRSLNLRTQRQGKH